MHYFTLVTHHCHTLPYLLRSSSRSFGATVRSRTSTAMLMSVVLMGGPRRQQVGLELRLAQGGHREDGGNRAGEEALREGPLRPVPPRLGLEHRVDVVGDGARRLERWVGGVRVEARVVVGDPRARVGVVVGPCARGEARVLAEDGRHGLGGAGLLAVDEHLGVHLARRVQRAVEVAEDEQRAQQEDPAEHLHRHRHEEVDLVLVACEGAGDGGERRDHQEEEPHHVEAEDAARALAHVLERGALQLDPSPKGKRVGRRIWERLDLRRRPLASLGPQIHPGGVANVVVQVRPHLADARSVRPHGVVGVARQHATQAPFSRHG
eukprot:scaffold18511_cov63-Phaeocystis_antarctica.AAC.3